MLRHLVSLNHLKDFASFILANHLDEFVLQDLKRAREVNLPILEFFKDVPEKQLIQMSKKGNIDFLEQIISGEIVDQIIQNNKNWIEDKLEGIKRDQVVASDIALIYNGKKLAFFHFLTRYSNDSEKILQVVREIENFYTWQDAIAIQTFSEINKDELQKRENRLREAQKAASLGYWDYNLEQNQVKWSEELYNIYGLDPDTKINSDIIKSFIVPDDVPALMEKVRDVYSKGGEFTHEYRICKPTGETRILIDKAYMEYNPDGTKILKGISQDITERKRAEEELKHREELLREAQAIAHLGSWEWDTKTNIVAWSDEMFRLFGYKPGEIKVDFQTYLNHVHPDDRSMVQEHVTACYNDFTPYTFQNRIIRKDGEVRWLMAKGQVNLIENGKVMKLSGIAMDITDEKEAEDKIRKSEALLLETQDISKVGSYDWNMETDVSIVTPIVKTIFGYDQDETPSFKQFTDLVHPEDVSLISEKMQDAFENRTDYQVEYRIVRKNDQAIRYIWAIGKVFYNNQDKPIRFVGSIMDITDRKLIEKELYERQIALEASNKELEAFCYTISHDLRSPLRAIDGFGRKLANQYNDKLDDEGRRLLSVVRNNAQQMGVLIDSLLDFSRLNRKEIKKAKIDFTDLVKGVINDCCNETPDIKAKFTVGKLANAAGDKDLLKQVWHNLILNAIKFSSKIENPEIEIGSKKSGDHITYYVKDNGAGFDMDYKDKLFGVFQRLHSADDFTGTGVGLATVQRIIHRHGGTVWAEGEIDKGATFYFTLVQKQEIMEKELSLHDTEK